MTTEAHAQPAREAATRVVRALVDAGHVAYFAGGCVRDLLLGGEPEDFDVATDATPDQVRAVFPKARLVGEAFGVALVRSHGHSVEVATFRAEAGYHDGRRPSEVRFTDARHDAQRRDFTINGLFEDPLVPEAGRPRIIDHVGGRDDLARGVIRAIGDPDERLGEDFLRMLRAVRFATRLGFSLDPATSAAIRRHAPSLARISRERIGDEVRRMLAGRAPATAAGLIEEHGLDAPALAGDSLRTQPGALAAMPPSTQGYAARLAAWMLDREVLGPAADLGIVPALLRFIKDRAHAAVARWREAMVLTNEETAGIIDALGVMGRATGWTTMPLALRKRTLAERAWPDAWLLLRALREVEEQRGWRGRPGGAAALLEVVEPNAAALLQGEVAPPALLDGRDLIAAGVRPGPVMGRLLHEVYDEQLEGRVDTREAALAFALRRHGELAKV